ncbi:MAG: outer membrane lipoprotein carrier protein LolA [Draconibacterium sp.]
MKVVLLAISFLCVSLLGKAQQDTKAKEILEKVSENTRTFKSVSADFTFAMENKEMDIHEKNDGSIKIKGQKYAVSLPDVGIKVFSDGSTIWSYMKDGNQVTVSNIDDESNELMDPASIFSIYEKGFQSKFIAEKNVGGKTVYEIELYPDTNEYDVSKISVEINKSNMMIQSAKLYGNDGNIYGIDVKKMETNNEFKDSEFVFNPSGFPDVEIIDLR